MSLHPNPLDNDLIAYIEAAENAGLDWIITGGPGESSKVQLARQNESDFCAEVEDSISPCIAFYYALRKSGVVI